MKRKILMIVVLLFGSSFLPRSTEAQETVSFTSSYITLRDFDDTNREGVKFLIDGEAVRRVTKLTVQGQLGGDGKLFLDGNRCNSFDKFGQPLSCTLVLYPAVDVTISKVAENSEWVLYSLNPKTTRFPEHALRLSVSKSNSNSANVLFCAHLNPDIVQRIVRVATSSPAEARTSQVATTADATTHEINIEGFKFKDNNDDGNNDESTIEIDAGDSIVWKNLDSAIHNARSNDSRNPFQTEDLQRGESSEPRVFRIRTGDSPIEYDCERPGHGFMKAKIIVK